jgi:four helix bundle protein
MSLALSVYQVAAKLPGFERFGLSNQLRRAVVSIPSNIAEGYGRDSTGSYANHLKIARGSLRELETQLLLTRELNLCDGATVNSALEHCDKVARLSHGLIRSIKKS